MKSLPHPPKKSQKINPVASKMAIRPWRVAPEEKKPAILRFDMFSICFRLKTRLTTPIFPKKPRGRAGQLFFFVFMLKWAFLIFSLKPSWGHLKKAFCLSKGFFKCPQLVTTRLKSGSARIDLLCMGPVGYVPTTTAYPYSS